MQYESRPELVAAIDPDGVGLQALMRALRGLDCRVVGFASASLAMAQVIHAGVHVHTGREREGSPRARTEADRAHEPSIQRRFDIVVEAQHGARFEGRSLGGALRARMAGACPTLVLVRSSANDAFEGRDYDVVLTPPIRVLELVAALDRAELARRGLAS